MNFDITSMKQRAKALMSTTKPNPKAIGVIFAILALGYVIGMFLGIEKENWILLIAIEFIYMNFRNCNRIYGLKVSREEKTNFSDVFSAFKVKPFQMIILSIVKDIIYVVGIFFFIVGAIIPFYCFRFSTQIIRDENVNAFKAMKRSCQLLKGHYGDLIKIDIIVACWYAATYFSFGILGLYSKPYSAIIYAEFYDYLKACNEMNI